jgi:hypothetical protein
MAVDMATDVTADGSAITTDNAADDAMTVDQGAATTILTRKRNRRSGGSNKDKGRHRLSTFNAEYGAPAAATDEEGRPDMAL